MNKEEAIKELTELLPEEFLSEYTDAIKMGIEALKQQPCEDCVSRQAALEAFGLSEKSRKYDGDHSGYDTLMKYEIQDILEDLPSVTAQPNMVRWIPVSERLPEDLEPVNITWVNHNPKGYYANIKDKPFTATGHYCKGRWYWYSSTCQDYLEEYGRCDVDEIDTDIEVTAWMELPEPYLPDINVVNMSEIPTGAEGSDKND